MKTRRPDALAWQAFAAICIMSIMWTGIQWNCMNLYAAPVVTELGILRTQFILVLSIPAVISAAVSLTFFGSIEQHFGLRRMMLVGGVLNTLAFVCWAVMDSTFLLYLGGGLYGLGASVTAFNSINAGIGRWFKQRMGSLVGVANALGNMAGIVFALVVAAAISTIGWRYSFGICALLSAVATLVCVVLYKGNPEDLGVAALHAAQPAPETETTQLIHADGMPFQQTLHSPRLWLMMLGYFLLGLTTYALMSTLPLFAVDFGQGALQGQVVSTSLVAAAVAVVPLGAICDRWGTKWGLAISGALMAASSLALLLPRLPLAAIMIVAIAVGAAYSACSVCVGVGVREVLGNVDFAKKLGLCSGSLYVGLAAGPALASLAFDLMGTYRAALVGFVILGFVMLAAFFVGMRPRR